MWLVREKEREEEFRRHNEENEMIENSEDNDKTKNDEISIWYKLYYSKIVRGVILILLIALIPIFLLLFMDIHDARYDGHHTCSYIKEYQILCGEQNTTLKSCMNINCCFNETDKSCFHTVPSYYLYKKYKTSRAAENSIYLEPVMEKTPFNKPNQKVYLYYEKQSKDKISITLSTNKLTINNTDIPNAEYDINILSEQAMAVEVNRTKSKETLLNTAHGTTIISERYWEWSVDLGAEHLFGMDFLRHPDNETLTRVLYKNVNDHSSVAKFIAYKKGKFHSLQIDHLGPLEVTVLPSRLILLRLLAGSYLTFHLSTGPTLEAVLQQLGVLGNINYVPPPYWALGVHICRDGAMSDINIEKPDELFNQNFPYDSDCIHESLFSITEQVNNYTEAAIKYLKETKNKHFMMTLSPQIKYRSTQSEDAQNLGILYNDTKTVYRGIYSQQTVVYPDYSIVETKNWFLKHFKNSTLNTIFDNTKDGIVLRNSWAANDKYVFNSSEKFQYLTKDIQQALGNTLPWNSTDPLGVEHIEKHNSYGNAFAEVISTLNPNFMLSSSHGSNSLFATHVQNVNTSWVEFKNMIRKTLSHSLFSGSLFSIPVCGSTEHFSPKGNQAVCLRWYLTAATMPLFRISSVLPRRAPSNFNNNMHMQKSTTEAIIMRYKLLPFYYTILQETPILVRPMFYHFHADNQTFALDEQYMIGDSLLVVQPTLYPLPVLRVYFPKSSGIWYEFWAGRKINGKGWSTLPIVDTDLVMFIQGGKIVPLLKETGNNAEESLKKPFNLIIALNEKNSAFGKLDLGNKMFEFQAEAKQIIIRNAIASDSKTYDLQISSLYLYSESTKYILKDLYFQYKINENITIVY